MNDDELTRRLRDAVPGHRAGFWDELEQRLADAPPAAAPDDPVRTVELRAVPGEVRHDRARPVRPLLVVLGAAAAVVLVVGGGVLLTQEAPRGALPAVPTLTTAPTPAVTPTSRTSSPGTTPTSRTPGVTTSSAGSTTPSRPSSPTSSVTKTRPPSATGTPTRPPATPSGSTGPGVTTTMTLTSTAGARTVTVDAVTRGRAPLTIDAATVELNTGPEAWLMGTAVDFGDGGADGSDPGTASCAADTPLRDVDWTKALSHTYAAAGTYTITYTVSSCRADQSEQTQDSTATLRVTVR